MSATKRKALGKGLGALIDSTDSNSSINDEIDIEYIETNPFQPRTEFDEEAIAELAQSIKELGIVQPITVRKIHDKKYQLISGERRYRASKIAGLEKVPAFIRTADDQEMLEMALVENVQRKDLNAIEVALSYQRLMDDCSLTQEEMSVRIGKKRSTVANYLRLLKLPAEVQVGISKGLISMGHARALVNLDDDDDKLYIFEQIINGGLSVRKVEELVRKIKEEPAVRKGGKTIKKQSSEYEELEKHLTDFFNTEINFKRNSKGNGKITISFKSDEELERIIAILDKSNS
jgi:ParB family chromosome partitioning protein